MLKPTTKEMWGTSLKGYLTATYDELVAKFGKPNAGASGDGKVKAEWILEAKGTIVTIYDYKEYSKSVKYVTDWHIGGFEMDAVKLIKRAFPKHNVRFA
jgi:hypothetical protein